jgi:hypothetical protein
VLGLVAGLVVVGVFGVTMIVVAWAALAAQVASILVCQIGVWSERSDTQDDTHSPLIHR